MGKTKSTAYYAVARGRKVGIFDSWSECRSLVTGFGGARYKKFLSREEAQKFVKEESSNKSWTGVAALKPKKLSTGNTSSSEGERGFSVNETDWTYDKDVGYSMNEDGWVKVFTDGACSKNGRIGASAGIGAFFGIDSQKNISEPVSGNHQTNNSAEIQAISQAIKKVKDDGLTKIAIYTDSKFVINSVEDWMPNWKRNGWKKSSGEIVINKNDFCELDDIKKGMQVKFIHVRGHQGIDGNERADALAREGVMK